MKKLDWFILVILLISPILINYIVLGVSVGATINGSIDGWLGYYGTLIGSIITMFVLYRTRAWNKDDNEDTRKTQNNILKYQVKQVWLEGLRKQLDANYRVLNFQETIIAANNIANGDCLKAMGYLMNLNKDIEMQDYSFDLYLSGDNLNENEIEYISCYQHVLKQYGEYVNDLILICGIKIRISQGDNNIISYINDSIAYYNELQKINLDVFPGNFIKDLEIKLNSNCTFQELENICASRIMDIGFIHSEKSNLQKATNKLLKFEENEIQKILVQ
ncbi:MAG: hypothetical protein J6C15_00010 [Bacteroidaceae bacterium]|nr:hypothetical protein [Bacteroidaceae bacterium]